MRKKKAPKWSWDFGVACESELLACMSWGWNKQSGCEEVTGDMPDISEWLDFGFCDLIWWWDQPGKPDISDDPRRLG